MVDAGETVLQQISTYWEVAAKTFAKACGVAVGWLWSIALKDTFGEELPGLASFADIIYAVTLPAGRQPMSHP